MREIWQHTPGKIYLLSLVASIVGMLVIVGSGLLEQKVLLLGFVTMPLIVGVGFIVVWLIAYLIYFFRFWPYR